jgi:RNA polymerase primary sigma factor
MTGGHLPLNGDSEQLKQLVRNGQARGFVRYEEIDRILSPGLAAVAELDTVLSELAMNSVEVMDEPRTEDSLPDENAFDEEESQNPNLAPIRMYIRELASVPRLTDEEERGLAKRVREARAGFNAEEMSNAGWLYAVDGTGRRYGSLGVVAPSESPAMQGADEAANRLIEANLWIALATATHYRNRGLSLLDLVQEGNIGLMRAVREYNYLRPYRFSTYAIWWVRKAIIRAIEDASK